MVKNLKKQHRTLLLHVKNIHALLLNPDEITDTEISKIAEIMEIFAIDFLINEVIEDHQMYPVLLNHKNDEICSMSRQLVKEVMPRLSKYQLNSCQ